MGSPLLVRSPNDLLYDYLLSSAYRSQWVYDPSFALSRDPDVWEVVRNDADLLGSMERYCSAVVKPWRIEPPKHGKEKKDKQYAEAASKCFDRIERFGASRRRLCEARFLARTYAVPLWEKRPIKVGGVPDMDWWCPVKLVDVDRRRIHVVVDWDRSRQRKIGTHLEMYDTDRNTWTALDPSFSRLMIKHVYSDTEDRVGYGRGLLEALYFVHYWRSQTTVKIAEGIDRWANGILVGKIDSMLQNSSTSKTNRDLADGMKTVLRTMRTEHVVVIQKGDEIEVVETSGTGGDMALKFWSELRDTAERLINGSVRPSGGATQTNSGARAQSQTEADTSETVHQDGREDSDAVLDRDLLGGWIYLNEDNIRRAGFEKAERPKFSSQQKPRQDPLQAVQVAQGLVNLGFPVMTSEISEMTDFSIAGPDDETLVAAPMQMDDKTIDEKTGFPKSRPSPDRPKPKMEAEPAEAVAQFSAQVMARLDKIEREWSRPAQPIQPPVVFANGNGVAVPVVAGPTINVDMSDIGHNVTTQLIAALKKELDEMQINISVPPAAVQNTINVPQQAAPIVENRIIVPESAAPIVNVAAPVVNVPQPLVTIMPAKDKEDRAKKITFETDAQGRIKGAEVS